MANETKAPEKAPEKAPVTATVKTEAEELREQNRLLQEQLATANKKLQSNGISEDIAPLVTEKIRLGLTRDQAVVCARRQVIHDAEIKKQNEAIADAKAKARAEAKATAGITREETLAMIKEAVAQVQSKFTPALVEAGGTQ
jgi:hypothetical protein